MRQPSNTKVTCTIWTQCEGGHLFESCHVDGLPHQISGKLKPDQSSFLRPGSDVDWTKRTFERFSLLVEPSKLLFYGHPTEGQLEWKGQFWPPPKLTDHEYIRNP